MGQFCFSIIRWALILENLVVATMATIIIYISLSALDEDFGMDTLMDNHPKSVHAYIAAISTGVGVIIGLLSMLGLYGAIKKSTSVLTMYSSIIFFMLLLVTILTVTTMTIRTDGVVYKDFDRGIVNNTIAVYNYTDSNDIKTRLLDHIQRSLSCCGINSPNDWKDYGQRKIPKSCCKSQASNMSTFKYCEQSDFRIGCWRAITDHFHANLSVARTFMEMIIAFGFVCALAAYFMVRKLHQSLEVV